MENFYGSATSIIFCTALGDYDQTPSGQPEHVRCTCSMLHMTVLIIPSVGSLGGIHRAVRLSDKLAVLLADLDNPVHEQDGCVPQQTSEGTPAPISLSSLS